MDKNIFIKIKQVKIKDVIYPAFTILAFFIFAVIFILSVKYLFESINSVFGDQEEYQTVRFDIDGFKRISGRLGIKL